MFKAMILICNVLNPTQCVIAEDTMVVTNTQKECVARVDTIIMALGENPLIRHTGLFKYRCVKIEDV